MAKVFFKHDLFFSEWAKNEKKCNKDTIYLVYEEPNHLYFIDGRCPNIEISLRNQIKMKKLLFM